MSKFKNDFVGAKETLLALLKWLVFAGVVGILAGTVGVSFHFMLNYATGLRDKYPQLLYLLPLGGAFIAFIYTLAGMENDKGTNGVISAVRSNDMLSLKTAPLIFVSTIITHLFGGSSGREGAALQIGGSIANKLGRVINLSDHDKRIMTMCGMSAAFAAVFGAPITAVIFSMEVISVGVMYYSALVPCALSALIGHNIAMVVGIMPTSFVVTGIPTLSSFIIIKVLVLAALCAVVSILFCVLMETSSHLYKSKISNPILRTFMGGLIVIALTLLVGSQMYNGAGTDAIVHALEGEARPEAFLLKMIFTAVTLGAGFKGGEIVPSFFTGATFGCVVGGLLGLSPSFGASVGLISVFCGVTNCPISSIILSVELFGGNGLMFYALACGVSYMMSGYFGLYGEQKILYSKLRPEFIDIKTK